MRQRVFTLVSVVFFLLLLQPANAFAETTSPSASPTAPSGTPSDEGAEEPLPDGDYIRVTLTDRDKGGAPVPDVRLTVAAVEEGSEPEDVGEDVTDDQGIAIIETPGPGTYVVTLDEDTLPDGVELNDATSTELEITARLGGATNAAFPIGTQAVNEVPFSEKFSVAMMSGIKFGLLVALAALGLSLIFGTTGLTNFAHGELITLGALLAYVFNRGIGLPVIVAGIAAVVASAFFGWAQDKALWAPLRRRGTGLIAMMIVSIGFGLFLRNVFQYTIGSSRKSLSEYVNQGRRDYGPISLADKELAIIVISLVTITITCIVLMRTRLGKAMRAVSDNPALSASSGMKVDRVISNVWILGTALTGLSGVLLAINSQINFLMGFKLLLLVFAGVTLGGLGTIWGALFGSMVIGIMVEVGPLFGVPSSIKEVGALVVLILVLLVRPQGILGRRERIG
ncbi:ABC transporter permease subunit [Nocardioides litoris]|uniref:ABC transporter permease subunit n=1 Tax=Nocardioides litoris TaxID=1926648 RepID=UPI001123E911|nr:branched-chain amino acid ABC transporter permease [Nocardioides litoris]